MLRKLAFVLFGFTAGIATALYLSAQSELETSQAAEYTWPGWEPPIDEDGPDKLQDSPNAYP